MKTSFKISDIFPSAPEKLYRSWLSSKEHSAFTGSPAKISSRAGGKFSAWDGYISGANVELVKGKRIVQRWRTTEFEKTDPDSLVVITFETVKEGTRLTLTHTEIPKGQTSDYLQGWKDFYFTPMKRYFCKDSSQ
jgi:activator of HSP90 ATPase